MRGRWIGLAFLLLLLAACGGEGAPGDGTAGENGVVISDAVSDYQVAIGSSDLAAGRSRLVLLFWDGPERLDGLSRVAIQMFSLGAENEAQEEVWAGEARGYTIEEDGLEYWVAYPEFPTAGLYGARIQMEGAGGAPAEQLITVQVKERPAAPAIGDPAPRSDTLTINDAPLEELSSGPPYVSDFYEYSIAEVAEQGKPAVVIFATPAYCTSSICAPVLNSAAAAHEGLGEQVNFVHVEVYRDFDTQVLDPAMGEWNLPSEPWVFLLDENGKIAARLDGPVSRAEILDAVAALQGS